MNEGGFFIKKFNAIVTLLIFLITLVSFDVLAIANENAMDIDREYLQRESIDFVKNTLSDGADNDSCSSNIIDNNAEDLKAMLSYRKYIRDNSIIQSIQCIEFDVEEIAIEKKEDKVEVFISTMEHNVFPNREDNREQYRNNAYKLLYETINGEWKITKAIADDFTGASITPQVIANPTAFKAYNFDSYNEDIEKIKIEKEVKIAENQAEFFEAEQRNYQLNKEQIEKNKKLEEEKLIKKSKCGIK